MTKTFFSIAHLHIALPGPVAIAPPAPLPQIQSPSLRIEFDKQHAQPRGGAI